jgi:ubiquinone/menaquinone biosynthesis C-methylase UbiE
VQFALNFLEIYLKELDRNWKKGDKDFMGNSNFATLKQPEFLDELPLWSASFGLKLLDYINYKSNITAIDIGFGTGFPLIELAMRLGNNSTIYGIDEWEDGIRRAEEKIKYYALSNVKILKGSVESIPLENNSVNLITSNNCINAVSNINNALMECSRILQKDGQFIQVMNLDKSMFEFYNEMEKILFKLNLKQEIEFMYKHIEKKRPSVDIILNILKNDFLIKDIEYDEFSLKFCNGTAMFNHFFVKNVFMKSWKEIIPKDRIDEIFEIIEKKLNEEAEKSCGIKLSIPFVLINSIKKNKVRANCT